MEFFFFSKICLKIPKTQIKKKRDGSAGILQISRERWEVFSLRSIKNQQGFGLPSF